MLTEGLHCRAAWTRGLCSPAWQCNLDVNGPVPGGAGPSHARVSRLEW